MNAAASDHWVITESGRLFVRRWRPSNLPGDPDGTILLFHDSLGCVDLWRDFPQQLAIAARRPVVAYDRLGFGRSDAYPGTLPLTFIRDEAISVVPLLLESLRLDAIIPLGHSVGGAMAVATAAHLPDRCATVITESAQSFVENQTLAGLRASRAKFEQPGQVERLAKYHGPKARWVLDAWIGTWLAPAFAGWRLDDDLRSVRCPVLALHGDQDEYGSIQHPERIARLSAGPSRVVILEEGGHVPHRQKPALVLREITKFLNSYSSTDTTRESR